MKFYSVTMHDGWHDIGGPDYFKTKEAAESFVKANRCSEEDEQEYIRLTAVVDSYGIDCDDYSDFDSDLEGCDGCPAREACVAQWDFYNKYKADDDYYTWEIRECHFNEDEHKNIIGGN